ncbi:MAG TPA: hypothetical protein VFS39_11780 [Nitrospira sp.]|nr:hypothetical protein [Nitrospira sp.]
MLTVQRREKIDDVAQDLLTTISSEADLASYRQELERRNNDGIPSLDDIEPGKIVGAVIPMSERAQTQMRDSIEVIDYLLNQERVVWS